MNTYAICPISNKRINENVARTNAFFTVAFLAVYLLSSNLFIIGFLLIDFLLRGMEFSQYSLFAIFSKKIVQLLSIKPKLINAGPKIFAARIGVVFSGSILISALFNLNGLAITLTAIFGVCALLEAAVGFCLACQIYPIVLKLTYKSNLNILK